MISSKARCGTSGVWLCGLGALCLLGCEGGDGGQVVASDGGPIDHTPGDAARLADASVDDGPNAPNPDATMALDAPDGGMGAESDASTPMCGNGLLEMGEVCDGPATPIGRTCTPMCALAPLCPSPFEAGLLSGGRAPLGELPANPSVTSPPAHGRVLINSNPPQYLACNGYVGSDDFAISGVPRSVSIAARPARPWRVISGAVKPGRSRINLPPTGAVANSLVASADGNIIVFLSYATNLTLGDRNDQLDAYLHDRQTGRTVLLSSDACGRATGASAIAITPNGATAFFVSNAAGLHPSATSVRAIYGHDVATSTRRHLADAQSFSGMGATPDSQTLVAGIGSTLMRIPLDGGMAVPVLNVSTSLSGLFVRGTPAMIYFTSSAALVDGDSNGAGDGYRVALAGGTPQRLTLGHQSNQLAEGGFASDVSADGRWFLFTSKDRNVLPGDVTSAFHDYLRDLESGQVVLVDRTAGGGSSPYGTLRRALSPDGQHAYLSLFSDGFAPSLPSRTYTLARWQRSTGAMTFPLQDSGGKLVGVQVTAGLAATANGLIFATHDGLRNDVQGVYGQGVWALPHEAETPTRVALAPAITTEADDETNYEIDMDAAGGRVVFASWANNLVEDDDNLGLDVFLYDDDTGQRVRISRPQTAQPRAGAMIRPRISADGSRIVFISEARLTAQAVPEGARVLYAYDVVKEALSFIALDDQGGALQNVDRAEIGDDGNTVVFRSSGVGYIRTMDTGAVVRVPGVIGQRFFLQGDGSAVIYMSNNKRVDIDSNGTWDVYRYAVGTGETSLLSVYPNGAAAAGSTELRSISADGKRILTVSMEPFAADDLGSDRDSYLLDLSSGTPAWTRVVPPGGGTLTLGRLSGDGQMAVFRLNNNVIRWRISDNSFAFWPSGQNSGKIFFQSDMAVSRDGGRVAVVADSNAVDVACRGGYRNAYLGTWMQASP